MHDTYVTQAMTRLVPLAQELDENKVTPGVLGFIVFAAMAGGVWLLMRSMTRHMGKVDFEEAPERQPKESAQGQSGGRAGTRTSGRQQSSAPHGE